MCSPSPPPAPDYVGAARQQGQANIDAAVAQGHINNPNVVNPYGTQTVTWNGNDPTVTQTLSPDQQRLLDSHNATQLQLSQLAGQGATAAQGIVGKPVDFSGAPGPASVYNPTASPTALDVNGLPKLAGVYQAPTNLPPMPAASQAIRDRVINAMMGRSNIDIGKQQDQAQSDLIARGITPGTKAYSDQMDMLNREKVDALQQAQIAGGNAAAQAYGEDLSSRQEGQQEALSNSAQTFGQALTAHQQAAANQGQAFNQRGQAIQLTAQQQAQQNQQQQQARIQAITEALAKRQIPLNEITALMSGSQVSNPFAVPSYAQNGSVAPAPIFGATQAQGNYNTDVYNAGVGSSNSLMSGLFGLGSAALMGPFNPYGRRG